MGDLKEPSQVGLFTARAPDAPRCKALVQSKHSTFMYIVIVFLTYIWINWGLILVYLIQIKL